MRNWDVRKWPRFLVRIHAKLCHYYWLPCPLCGKPCSGAETRATLQSFRERCISSFFATDGNGHVVCPKCAEERAQAAFEARPPFPGQGNMIL